MTITSQDLLEASVAALLGPDADAALPAFATSAGARVYQPGDWPTQSDQYPVIKARLLTEQKSSLGRGGINFTVVTTIRFIVEVSEPVQLDNAGATAAERAIWALVRQIEVALINGYPLTSMVQQFPSISTTLAFNSDTATHLAGANIDVAFEFYQGIDDFAPIAADELGAMDFDIPGLPGAGTTIPLS